MGIFFTENTLHNMFMETGEKRADESLIPRKCPAIYFWVGKLHKEHEEKKVIFYTKRKLTLASADVSKEID